MSLFGNNPSPMLESEVDMDMLVEMFLIDEANHKWSDAQIKEFCAPGGIGDALVEAKVLHKKTAMRLSKKDDLERRRTMAAIELAKKANDSLYQKLIKVYAKKEELKSAIIAKYGNRATKLATLGQKEYIKKMKKVPQSFMKAGGADRL